MREGHRSAEIPARLVAGLDRALESAWEDGWQPADLMRLVRRDVGKRGAEILRAAIAWQATDYEQWARAVAPEWLAQLEELGADPVRDPLRPWPIQMGRPLGEVVTDSRELHDFLRLLPAVPRLMPPPSEWPRLPGRQVDPGRLDKGMLAKIRALLAKAESTEFDSEAEAFTAKAQELMTRHRIDQAGLETGPRSQQREVIGRRLGVERPYTRAKFMLIAGIARANSCRAVWSEGLGFATVFGHPEDVEAVEELYTSLLVQATSALGRERSRPDRKGSGRTRRFRRSFLIGFAVRIGERLQAASNHTVRKVEEETGRHLVPVLTAREEAAQEAMNATHRHVRSMSMSVSDGEGFRAGIRVADRADLGGPPERLAATSRRRG